MLLGKVNREVHKEMRRPSGLLAVAVRIGDATGLGRATGTAPVTSSWDPWSVPAMGALLVHLGSSAGSARPSDITHSVKPPDSPR